MNELNRILLSEDNPEDIELTLAALGEVHLANEVVADGDGAEALDYLRRQGRHAQRPAGHPAVVFFDLKMPKVDGLDVLRAMRGDPEWKAIPVVILTSSKEERDLVEGYRTGANAYVVKPVDFRQFTATVRDLGLFWAIQNDPPPGSAAGKRDLR